MAVEAHQLNPLFSSNRDMIHPVEANGLLYNSQTRYGTVPTFNSTVECQTSLLNPIYNIAPMDYLVHQSMKPTIQSVDSSITFNSEYNNANNVEFLPPISSSSLRKRPRQEYMQSPKTYTDSLKFLGQDDMSFNLQNPQMDIDRLISNHVERMRIEIEEKRKTQRRRMVESIEQGLMKTLKAKDDQINHIAKLNLFLEEKVKSLSVENQIWRDVAQSNEATVNALRSNLQQVLAAVERNNRWEEPPPPTVADDAESCCGSSDEGEEAEDKEKMRSVAKSMCRSCGKGEASVLLLPCRHMCLCTVCGSLLNTCPVCKSPKNASLHVNLSS